MTEAEELSAAWHCISALWSRESLVGLRCCHCQEQISEGTAFARTFAIASTGAKPRGIRFPALSDRVEFFNRHLNCLFESTRYVAVSHVWDTDVARLQYKKREAYSSAIRAAGVLRSVPVQILEHLAAELPGSFEIWHDYLSVPQWDDDVKRQILTEIPMLYRGALLTVAYLADVDEDSFNSMRTGVSSIHRCRGMGRICSAAWFSRVWTAMELAQSSEVRIMVKNFRVIAPDAQDPPLTHELWRRWKHEVMEAGTAKELEALVHRDGNLVPWQLGTMIPIRLNNLARKRTCFGIVHSVLSRRRTTIQQDVLYALEGLLKSGTPVLPSDQPKDSLLRLAHSCMLAGDLSPLFMIPASAPSGVSMALGFADHATWGMGIEQMPPTFTTVRKADLPFSVTIQAEEIGGFKCARLFDWGRESQQSAFSTLCRMTLEACGPDVDAFVSTVGARLYGQLPDSLNKRLDSENRRSRLKNRLQTAADGRGAGESPETFEWIAETMGLSNTSLGEVHEDPLTPMTFLQHHGLTVHHGNLGAIVQITCTQCHDVHLLRIALFKPAAELNGAKAYRIPGLKYRFSHQGGVGLLVQNNRLVGRFLWGTPTCTCPKLVEVSIIVDDIPLPKPDMG